MRCSGKADTNLSFRYRVFRYEDFRVIGSLAYAAPYLNVVTVSTYSSLVDIVIAFPQTSLRFTSQLKNAMPAGSLKGRF